MTEAKKQDRLESGPGKEIKLTDKLKIIVGPLGSSKRYIVTDPPPSWNLRERYTPWCIKCGHQVRLAFNGVREGVATCRCPDIEPQEFKEG